MALANYTDLVASVNGSGGWLHRSDLSTIVPDWVTLCETTINYGDVDGLGVEGLRTADQETIGTVTTTSGTQTVALPSGFLEMRKVYITFGSVRIELPEAPISPIRSDETSNVRSLPKTYTIVAGNLYLSPIPDSTYTITLTYYAKVGPLATSSTNWLMTAAPLVYLAGTIYHGSPWLGPNFDPTRWAAMFKQGMSQVSHNDARKRSSLMTMRSEAAEIAGRGQFNIYTGT